MTKIPDLNVITKMQDLPNTTTFYNMIEENTLLKTKLKLLHIYYFDKDLRTLHDNKLDLFTIGLADFHLTPEYQLIVPVENRIEPLENTNKNKLKSYLIYLSYLYNFNFFPIYYDNPKYFYRLLFELHISEDIKQNLFKLLNNHEALYFSDNIEDLNNAEYRTDLREDTLRLRRERIYGVK